MAVSKENSMTTPTAAARALCSAATQADWQAFADASTGDPFIATPDMCRGFPMTMADAELAALARPVILSLCDQLDAAREEGERREAEADKIHADRVRLADALRAWRTWAIQRALPWDKRDDQHDDERRASVDERIATLTRERDAFSTDMLARERDTALAEAARLRELVVEACDIAEDTAEDTPEWTRVHGLIATIRTEAEISK